MIILYYTCTHEDLELFLIFKDNDEFINFSNRLKKDPLIDVEYEFNTVKKESARRRGVILKSLCLLKNWGDGYYDIRPILMQKGASLAMNHENVMLNEVLLIHTENFLSDFVVRADNTTFLVNCDGMLTHSAPNQEVFLHGLDEKIYENTDNVNIRTLFHKCRDEKRLHNLLPLKGCIVMKKMRSRLIKVKSQDDILYVDPLHKTYKRLWANYMHVLGIVQEMCVKTHNIPLRTI